MANSVVKLSIDSQEYDAKLKQAGKALNEYFDIIKKGDRTFEVLDDGVLDAVKALGQMETASKSAKGSLSELQRAFTDMSLVYRRFTDEEKASPVGKAMAQSLSELKARINDTKKDLASIQQEMSGSKFGRFGNVIDSIGHKFGVTANVTELLTSRTALMAAGIGAAATGAAMAAKKWAEYNQELAKQDQQTNIITGLDGFAANKMTDTMRALSDTYKVDFRAAVEAANTLMSQFGKSGDEAISLIKDGMQGMMMGEGGKMLQMIQQYAPAFRDAGVSASQLIAVIHNTQGGLFSPENMSAIVMGMKNIRLMTKQTSDALAKLGIDGKKMSQDLNNGTITVFDALKQVAGELKNVDSNSQAAGQVMQAVFGRQGAMAGTNLAKAIEELNTNLDETKKKTGDLGDAFADLQTANEKLNTAIRDAFSYDGWEQMATGIKSTLISALADVVNILDGIGVTWDNLMKKMGLRQDYKNTGVEGGLMNALPNTIKEPAQQISELRTSTNRQATYNRQVSQYDARIAEQQKKVEQLTATPSDPALKAATEAYRAAHPEWQSVVNDEKKTLADLQQMRAAYMKQGQEVLKEKPKQGPAPLPTSDTGGKKTPAQQAQAKYDQAEKDYNQALKQITLELNAKSIDTVEAKKKELAAEEALWKAIGNAREVHDDPKLKDAHDEAARRYTELGGTVNTLVEEQKKAQEAARKLAAAQEKAATAYQQMQTAQANNDLKAYNTALKQYKSAQADVQRIQTEFPNLPKKHTVELEYIVTSDTMNVLDELKKIEGFHFDDKTMSVTFDTAETMQQAEEIQGFKFEPKEVSVKVEQPKPVQLPVEMSYTESNMSAFLATLKEKVAQSDLGSTLYNNLTAQLADANALANLMQVAIKNGIDVSQFNPQELWSKVFGDNPGDYISSQTLKDIEKAINEELKKMKLDPIVLNVKTGDVSGAKKLREYGESNKEIWSGVTSILHSASTALRSFDNPALDIAATIADAIANVALAFSKSLQGTVTPWDFIAGVAGGAAAMSAAIVAIKKAGSESQSFATGGIVSGNSYSGDNTWVRANAGELILNQSSQNNLASAIQNAENLVGSIGDIFSMERPVFAGNVDLTGEMWNRQPETTYAIIESDTVKLLLRNGAQRRGKTISQYLEI